MIATRANHVYGLYMYIIQTTVKPFESEHLGFVILLWFYHLSDDNT